MPVFSENILLNIACFFYFVVFVQVFIPRFRQHYGLLISITGIGLVCHTISIALRWQRVGHGPFINLYEILNSNVWSLMLAFLLFIIFVKRYRYIAPYLVPVPILLTVWLLLTPTKDTFLPPTYHTIWLYFHVFSGKFFLSLLMLATGLALYLFHQNRHGKQAAALPAADRLSYLLLAFAFCFETLMLFFGAIWAQDAWGRYWAWDPLETWAFITWLSVLFVLHWRSKSTRYDVYAALMVGSFILAFLTFFG
ncbi:MAG: cytochrome c biogenesis protein CcsA, partial [Gammaproteobacteria bacterium]|nr:cytochrome c biogenesis protein CcsA [Gammaproteobacteria bacterium]